MKQLFLNARKGAKLPSLASLFAGLGATVNMEKLPKARSDSPNPHREPKLGRQYRARYGRNNPEMKARAERRKEKRAMQRWADTLRRQRAFEAAWREHGEKQGYKAIARMQARGEELL